MHSMSEYEFIKYLEDNEEAKPIINFPGYFITNKGRVWSNRGKGNRSKWLTPTKSKRYYWCVTLYDINNKRKGLKIHTLVGRHFLNEYKSGLFILHKNENLNYPEINYLKNLWVGTNRDNIIDMYSKNRYIVNVELRKQIGKNWWNNMTESERDEWKLKNRLGKQKNEVKL
jgi:hypothetical protein